MAENLDRIAPLTFRVLAIAQQEAIRLNHAEIGPEHLLLGLGRVERCLAMQVLRDLGVESGQIVRTTLRATPVGERQQVNNPTLSGRSKTVIELSVGAAAQAGDHYIYTEHLLLGLIDEGGSKAVTVLQALGLDVDTVRARTQIAIQQRQRNASYNTDTVPFEPEPEDSADNEGKSSSKHP